MNRITKLTVTVLAVAVVALLVGFFVGTQIAGATPKPYALGKATTCRIDFHKSTLTHVVHGKRVRYVACVYKAPVAATSAPVTTTTPGDPPTNVSILASETPAIVGDLITYTMTVADVLTATQAGVYMTDNGATIPNCTGPTPSSEGSLLYSCNVIYADGDVGDHLIAGIFLGDETYGQSAGQIDEPVQEPTLTAIAPPTDTATTTQPPAVATVTFTQSSGLVQQGQYGGYNVGFYVDTTGNYQRPTGNETLYVNGVALTTCTPDSSLCVANWNGPNGALSGPAILEFAEFAQAGDYTVTVEYNGDFNYPAAQSQTITVSIP